MQYKEIGMYKFFSIIPCLIACNLIIEQNEHRKNPDEFDTGWNSAEDDTASPATIEEPVDTEDHAGVYYLVPNTAGPDDTFITSIRSENIVDWGAISNITAFGEVTICKTQALYDQMLVTIHVNSDAMNGAVDVLVEYTDGDVDLIENGLLIDDSADVGTAAVDPSECE